MQESSTYSGQHPVRVYEIKSALNSSCRFLAMRVSACSQHPLLSLQGHAFPLALARTGLLLKVKSDSSSLETTDEFLCLLLLPRKATSGGEKDIDVGGEQMWDGTWLHLHQLSL